MAKGTLKPFKIVHISDLHFGTTTPELLVLLEDNLYHQSADLIVISGDFTQNGTKHEFKMAKAFLNRLKAFAPLFLVPGNHDFSRHNMMERFVRPYARYKKYISRELCPVFKNDQIFMVGINTARPFQFRTNWSHGRISSKQIKRIDEIFKSNNKEKTCRIFVCHHPIMDIQDAPVSGALANKHILEESLIQHEVELVLTGHIHQASVTVHPVQKQQAQSAKSIIYVGASTASSSRLRLHTNGFNVINIWPDCFQINILDFDQTKIFKSYANYTIDRITGNMVSDPN